MLTVTVYSRPGCHLCDEMKAVVDRVARWVPLTMEIIDILETTSAITAPARPTALPTPARGEIRFEGVTFTYPRRDIPALDNFSLAIRPGERHDRFTR